MVLSIGGGTKRTTGAISPTEVLSWHPSPYIKKGIMETLTNNPSINSYVSID